MARIPQPRTAASAHAAAARSRTQPSAGGVLALQRAAGNRAVGRLVQRAAAGRAGRQLVQRDVNVPADVAGEMTGRTFRIAQDFTAGAVSVKAGDKVTVTAWDNAAATVTVKASAAGPTFDVPKDLIRPDEAAVAGVASYGVGLDKVAKGFEGNEQKLAHERGLADPDADEITRLEGLETNWIKVLNERLIQGAMFNRFDASIKAWTDHYNTQFGFAGNKAADPDMVKAMIFQESQMGTAGPHLDDPPTHPVRTRFNIGQMIDTSSLIILELIREDDPGLIAKYHLKDMVTDKFAAENDLERLKKLRHPDSTQTARIAELVRLSGRDWEVFFWGYKAAGETTGFADAVAEYFGTGSSAKNMSYDFWIRASIRELFEKRKLVSTWEEAARAYNGAGPAARRYRDQVIQRMNAAKAAQKGRKEFVVDSI